MSASQMYPGQDTQRCPSTGHPREASASATSSPSATIATVPARRARLPRRVVARTSRHHRYQWIPPASSSATARNTMMPSNQPPANGGRISTVAPSGSTAARS
jgi:hypothetical protein